MAFGKFVKTQYPPRHWALLGFAVDGKSTFAGQMKRPLAVIDTDNRFAEIIERLSLGDTDAMPISNNRDDHIDPKGIAKVLADSKGEKVGTILVDSLTGIIQPRIVKAMSGGNAGNSAKGAAMMDKAVAMRTLVDSLQNFGSDYLLIWHQENRRDQRGSEVIHETLPPTEREALYRALNMILMTVVERDDQGNITRRGIRVEWARNGVSGITLWDEPGNFFAGMPERIEAAVYEKGVKKDTFGAADSVPAFTNMGEAVTWAVEKKAFPDREAAKAAYLALKDEAKPATAQDMFNAWIKRVNESLAAKAA